MKDTLKQIGILLLASAVLAGAANLVHPRKIPWVQDWSAQVEEQARDLGVPVVSLATAFELFKNREAVFIDARPEEEYFQGHVPGALSVPLSDLGNRLFDLMEFDQKLVAYCSGRDCDDALLLAVELKKARLDSVVLIDGFEGWKKAGGEVER